MGEQMAKRIISNRRRTPEEIESDRRIVDGLDKDWPEIVEQQKAQVADISSVRLAEIGKLLRVLRIKRGLSLSDMQGRTGIDRAALSRIENGRDTNPTIGTIARIADAMSETLFVSTAELENAERLDLDTHRTAPPFPPY